MTLDIPQTQTVALVNELGGRVEFREDYPVPTPGHNEVLAKVLYTGVCQSDLHTKSGTAASSEGTPITNIKFPHVGGHEGVGRIVALGPGCGSDLRVGGLVGIRFSSRICRRCEFCLAGTEQYCIKSTNHLHHEDGSFQQYIALDADYLTILPDDIDPKVIGPVLCAGVTAYKAVLNTNIRPGNWLVVVGAGGGLGHLAVQYAKAQGALVIGVDAGDKRDFVLSLGAVEFIDFTTMDPVQGVHELTGLGAHAAVVTAGSAKAFANACEMLRVGGILSCVGIPPGRPTLQTPIATIVIKGLRIIGNLVGSLKECMEAVELVRRGVVKPEIKVRPFKDLPQVYEEMEKGDIAGRIVLQISE
ncbi:zinc-dependent alcohol dehydrogenase [Aspergillus saccharolyticus JOP 1030-1]|uniref:Putative alcohol dehydrogenase n=1 Tax=Aspergillus saccharolyticus JOP 1030-1 TaxID=1450539 RepID=A0A318ZEE5_9EURO|nr:putative alcohol dehydrogenase [Aspergillus saccharolyticus JOP 1030-1]PYH45017.1 putative alcohol dehydrogenase [Aspergillus saccharolyticus JOP 1030-1]